MMLRANSLRRAIFFLLLLAIPTQLGKHFWPTFAYVAGQRVDYLSPTLYVTDVLIFVLFILTVIKKELVCVKQNLALVSVIILYLSVGIFFSQSPLNGWYMFLKILEFVFFGWYVSRQKNLSPLIFWAFFLGIGMEGILGILQFFHQGSMQGIWYFFGERLYSALTPGIANATIHGQLVLRPYGTFPHPNVFAGYLVIALLFFFVWIWKVAEKWQKILSFIIFIFGSLVLFLTLSRVAIVVFIVLVFVYLLTKLHKQRIWILFGICILLFGILLSNPLLGGRFFDIRGYVESITIRDMLLMSSWWMFVAHPLLGVGLGNFLPSLPSYLPHNLLFGLLQPVHNIFLLILAETGIFGFIIFPFILYKAFLSAWDNKASYLSQFALLSFGAICFIGMTDHYFLTLQQGQLLLALVLGLCFSVLQ